MCHQCIDGPRAIDALIFISCRPFDFFEPSQGRGFKTSKLRGVYRYTYCFCCFDPKRDFVIFIQAPDLSGSLSLSLNFSDPCPTSASSSSPLAPDGRRATTPPASPEPFAERTGRTESGPSRRTTRRRSLTLPKSTSRPSSSRRRRGASGSEPVVPSELRARGRNRSAEPVGRLDGVG